MALCTYFLQCHYDHGDYPVDLLGTLSALAHDVEKKLDSRYGANEYETRRASIIPFIRALRYDPDNSREVKEEFPVGDGHVDYAIKQIWRPIVFVKRSPRTAIFRNIGNNFTTISGTER